MISHFFHIALYQPIYNLLIFFVDIVPGADMGIAVILVTIVIRLIIAPLSISAAKTQRRMKFVEPQLLAVKEKYKDDKGKQAEETMKVYKNNGIKPFASIGAAFLQLPVIIALYMVFRKESLLHANVSLVYHFISLPTTISPLFLHYFTIAGHNIFLAILAGIGQFAQAHLTIPMPAKQTGAASGSQDFARALALQSRVVLPVLIAVFAYTSGAVALYFITSSIVGILQEFYVRYSLRNLQMPQAEAA